MSTPYRLRARRPATTASAESLLGPVERSFRGAAARNSVWAASPFVLLLGYGVWLAHQGMLDHWFNSTFSVVAVAILFVLSAALIVYSSAVGGGELVRVHSAGILDLRVGPRAVRWDEMRELVVVPPEAEHGQPSHVLHTTDGTTIALGPSIGQVEELVEELRARMAEHQLPEVHARIAEGDVVRFGAIEASQRGLSMGQRVVVWDDVAEIEAESGNVVVCTTGGERVAVGKLAEVPNAFLLAEMAHAHRARR